MDAVRIGRVAGLWRYPIKALAAEALEASDVDARGLAGDRGARLDVLDPAHARAGKAYRGKEEATLHTVRTAEAAVAIGAARRVALGVREAGGPFFDDSPVSVVLDRWLDEGSRLAGLELEALRFRPNLLVASDRACALDEADLVGATLAVGGVRLAVTAGIRRCVTIGYDVATGRADARVARAIARDRDNVLGVYAEVARAGRVAVGDEVVAYAR